MKQKLFLGGIIFLVIGFILFSCFTFYNEKSIINNSYNSNRFNKSLSMMIETNANSGIYEESKNGEWPKTGYTFNSSLSKCENGSTLTWDNATKKVIMNGNISDKCYVYFDAPQPLLADYIKGKYTSQGANGLYYHDNTLANGANDNSYRYAGANPNNYVCFGSDAVPCPEDNLYRIIGVFGDQVKLIKSDYATVAQLGTDVDYNNYQASGNDTSHYKGSQNLSNVGAYYWNYGSGAWTSNIWNESKLNKVNLNTNYINNLGTIWMNKIATTIWKVGGNKNDNIVSVTIPNTFKNEIVNPLDSTTYDAKIGLMYVSDYGYAADPSAWTTILNSYNTNSIPSKNWMYMGLYEWTIFRQAEYSGPAFDVFVVSYTGQVFLKRVSASTYALRPVFYINQWELYAGGDGTKENPIRMKSPDNLIAFTISDPDGSNTIQYYAENGMTWEQFVNSKYNVNGIYNDGVHILLNKDSNNSLSDILPVDIIQSNNKYVWISSDHSGGQMD